MIPYTYLLGWKTLNKWYYGVRYAKDCAPTDIWVKYKTSSKHVKLFAEQHGDPDVIEVRKLFTDKMHAILWEHKVLKRMNVISNEKWLNKTDNKSIDPMYGNDNPAKRVEVRKLISERAVKKIGNENPMKRQENKDKVSKKIKGRINFWQFGESNMAKSDEVRKKLSKPGEKNSFFGKSHSEEFKKDVSLRFKNKPKEKVQCPHCEFIGGKNTMFRWHFGNCKEKLDSKN